MNAHTQKKWIAIDPKISLSQQQLNVLKEHFRVHEGWPAQSTEIQGLLLHSKITESFLSKHPSLEWIAIRAKNTDYAPSTSKIHKFGIESMGGIPVAEHTFMLIMALFKNLRKMDANVRSGCWSEGIAPIYELHGKTLGIIGYGSIGKRVAEIGRAFGMNILIAESPSNRVGRVPLGELLSLSDCVSVHVSGIHNQYLIGEKEISLIKPGAVFINTSRGYLVNEKALLNAIEKEAIAGVGLDVCENEPPSLDTPLRTHPKVLLTPHMGYQTKETLELMNQHLVEKVIRLKSTSPKMDNER